MTDAWSYSAASGFTLANASSDVVVGLSPEVMPSSCEIVLSLTTRANAVGVFLFGSGEGHTGWFVWVDASGDIQYLQKIHGVITVAAVVMGSSNVLADGVPFTLAVKVVGNVITAKVTSGVYNEAEYSVTISDDLDGYNRWGFFSAVNGAVVLSSSLYQLAPANRTISEILLVVCGGLLFVCSDEDGELLRQVPGRVADSIGQVGIAEFDGVGLIVGGGRASVYDPITDAIAPWYDDEHTWNGGDYSTLPGATPPTSTDSAVGRGTCGCTIIEVHNSRVFMAGLAESPEVVFASATNDRNSWRLVNIELGEASAFTINSEDTVTCLKSLPSQNLLIGCRTRMKMLLGDPLWGQITVPQVAESGVSGPYAVALNEVGQAAAHSPAGLFSIPITGALPENISSGILTEAIQYPQGSFGSYTVSLVRSNTEHRLYVFITSVAESASYHFVYDERVGRYQPGTGYFFPIQFPVAVGPTAAVLWRGEVLVGTRNGLILSFDEDATSDKVAVTGGSQTQNIESWMFLTMTADSHPVGDTILTSWRCVLSDDSDGVTMKVYGGATAEALYDFTKNTMIFSASVESYAPPFIEQVRSPAMSMFIYADGTTSRYWELEQVVGNFEVGTMTSHRPQVTPAAPAAPGRPPAAASGTGSPTTPGGSGPGGGSNPPGGGYGGGTPPGGGGGVS